MQRGGPWRQRRQVHASRWYLSSLVLPCLRCETAATRTVPSVGAPRRGRAKILRRPEAYHEARTPRTSCLGCQGRMHLGYEAIVRAGWRMRGHTAYSKGGGEERRSGRMARSWMFADPYGQKSLWMVAPAGRVMGRALEENSTTRECKRRRRLAGLTRRHPSYGDGQAAHDAERHKEQDVRD